MKNNLDSMLDTLLSQSLGNLIPWFLMSSYLYYHRDAPMLSDGRYDELCKQLDKHWYEVDHRHKCLINRDWLSAGSCFIPREGFPTIIKAAACAVSGTPWERSDDTGNVQVPVQPVAMPTFRKRTRPA